MRLFKKLSTSFRRLTGDEHGQAIVLIAITALVLLAFVGLAIDGGRLYFVKRDTQTAADAGGLAAARAMCTLRNYETAAINAVEANGFFDSNASDTVKLYSPPQHSDTEIPPECQGCFVEVEVGREIPPSFTQLVFDGPLKATSYSITMCNPDTTYGLNADGLRALWTGSPSCNNTVAFTGSDNNIYGGVHSNNIIHAGGQGTVVGPVSYVGGISESQSGQLEFLTEDDVLNNNQYTVSGACDISCFIDTVDDDQVYPWENPYQVDEVITDYPLDYSIADFRPGGSVEGEVGSGNYHAFTSSNCNGNDSSLDGDWLEANGLLTGNVITDGVYYSQCDIQLNGIQGLNGNVTLVAENEITFSNSDTHVFAYYDDLLAFTEEGGQSCNAKVIKFSGSTNEWVGNMYAPNGKIEMSASSNTTAQSCLVAYAIDLSGSATTIVCDPKIDQDKSPAISFK